MMIDEKCMITNHIASSCKIHVAMKKYKNFDYAKFNITIITPRFYLEISLYLEKVKMTKPCH